MPPLTFDETTAETVIETFGWEVSDDPEDLVVDADGEAVEDFHGHYITIHQFAGVVVDENGDPTPLRDSFPAICDYVAHKRERGAARSTTGTAQGGESDR